MMVRTQPRSHTLKIIVPTNSSSTTAYPITFLSLRQRQRNQFRVFPYYITPIVIVVVITIATIGVLIIPIVQGFLVTPQHFPPCLKAFISDALPSVSTIDSTTRRDRFHRRVSQQPRSQPQPLLALLLYQIHHRRTTTLNIDLMDTDEKMISDDKASLSSVTATKVQQVPKPMRFIRGLQEIIQEYDIFLIDMWGVLHDGKQPYEYVLNAIQQMKQSSDSDKVLILLSNSSQRYHHSMKNLQQLGFQKDDFHTVITSGEVTYQMILNTACGDTDDGNKPSCLNPYVFNQQWEPLRSILQSKTKGTNTKNMFILGSGDDDIPYCTSCGWTPITNINDAHLILARGPFTIPIPTTNIQDVEDSIDKNIGTYSVIDRRVDGEYIYQQTLQHVLQIAADQLIPMIISNPDKVRPDADRSPMPGQIGDLYESILMQQHQQGTCHDKNDTSTYPLRPASLIKRIGKPFPDVYDMAVQSLSGRAMDKSRICMIGDALETDITGGTMFGIDTIWVLNNGVHSIDIRNNLDGSSESDEEDILKSANIVLDTFNNNNIGTYAENKTLSPTFVIPYFQW